MERDILNKNFYCVIDTETVNGIIVDGKLDLSQSLCYDIGWVICDKKGKVIEKRSFVVSEIFFGYKDLMISGYYADKLNQYYQEIEQGKRWVNSILEIWRVFLHDCKLYDVKAIMAYNTYFDYNALNNTIRYLTKSKFRYFFPKRFELWDIMKMIQSIIAKRKSYIAFCERNNYLTKHKKPRPQIKAETVYKFITPKANDFVESHTGLEDALIESQIFAYCIRQHKKMNKKLFSN